MKRHLHLRDGDDLFCNFVAVVAEVVDGPMTRFRFPIFCSVMSAGCCTCDRRKG